MKLKNNTNEKLHRQHHTRNLFLVLLFGLMLVGCQGKDGAKSSRGEVQEENALDNSATTEMVGNVSDDTALQTSIQSELMNGNFSCLDADDQEVVQRGYEIGGENDLLEWRQIDLNGDGIEDLILQEKDTVTEESSNKRITGIFACREDGASCVLWDVNDSTEYSFCGQSGELMYYYDSWGTEISVEIYEHYEFDKEWNHITDYRLQGYCIDSSVGDGFLEEWKEEHPDMAEDGYYYRKYTGAYAGEAERGEVLTFEEFKAIYEAEMGMEFYSYHLEN